MKKRISFSIPVSFRADVTKILSRGLRSRASFFARSVSNGRKGERSALVMIRQLDVVKALGYFFGLSSPSGVERRIWI